ncbi:MAG: aldehyde dehydrogenase family protein [Armatimonadota bacterium]
MNFQFVVAGRKKASHDILPVINPYNGKEFAETYKAQEADIEEAVAKSVELFEKTRRMSSMERAQALVKTADNLESKKEEFAEIIAREAGKPIRFSRIEVDRAVSTFRIAAEEAKRIKGEVLPVDIVPSGIGRTAVIKRFPIGPVLGITPFNFPLMLVAHKVAPAIASGNPVIIKPASKTPLSALMLGFAVLSAGWEAISVLPCSSELAEKMVADDRIKLLTFTGSDTVGWALKAKSGKKKVALELGGNAAVIVHKDADIEDAAKKCVTGGFSYSGQVCISVQRIYVHTDIYDEFKNKIKCETEKLKTGDPMDENTDISALIDSANLERVKDWVDEAVKEGGRIISGGNSTGSVYEPTIMENVPQKCAVVSKEVFGPVIVLEGYDDFDKALDKVNDSRFGLQAGVFTNDIRLIMKSFDQIDAGGVIINNVSAFRIDSMPYGGVKDSGLGREGPRWAIEEMTEPKIMILS